MATEQFTPKTLAPRVSKALGRTVSPKQIRGRVRGDSGAPLLPRFGPDVKGAYSAHVYTPTEADLIGSAFIKSDNVRTGRTAKWLSVKGRTVKPAVKPVAAVKPVGAVKPAPLGNRPPTVKGEPVTAIKPDTAPDA